MNGYFNLRLTNFICTCQIEKTVNQFDGVKEAFFNPVTGLLTVKTDGALDHAAMKHNLHRKGIEVEEAPALPAKHEMGDQKADHHLMMEEEIKSRLAVALIFTIPVIVLSPTVQGFFGVSFLRFPGSQLLLFLLASVVVIYGGMFFYKGAYRSVESRVADMNVLVTLAVLAGYLYSAATTFFIPGEDFYWEISTLVVFLLFGHWMEMRAVRGASGALRELVKLIPPTANLVRDGQTTEVPTEDLNVEDIILIRPGEKVPIDGVVSSGESSINESMITGESKPVHKKSGDEVLGGTINGEGAFQARVTKTGGETALGQIIQLVQDAQASKPPSQRLADKAAGYLVFAAAGAGIITLLAWNLAGAGFLFALSLTITVLIIACPHALGLAIPTVTSISTTLAARNGLLVKKADALEFAKDLDVIVFDKTGTLTKGEFGVTEIIAIAATTEDDVLRTASSVERFSEHVIAKAIIKKAQNSGLEIAEASDFKALPGKGAIAFLDGSEILVGNRELMNQSEISLDVLKSRLDLFGAQGKTIIFVAADGRLLGAIALADLIREESYEAIQTLKKTGAEIAMMTGDSQNVAQYVSSHLGLDLYFAEVLPEQKSSKIRELQERGKRTAMVGDGVNDAPALVQADIGIAIGAGTDVAVESADIVLVKNDPRDVSRLIKLSAKTARKMRQNLWWAAGYNIVAIPVAAGILFPFNIFLRPEWGALIMSASSIIVVLNALLLRRMEL